MIPSANQVVVEQGQAGRQNYFSRPWYRFLQAVDKALSPTSADPTVIVVGASPFVQTANNDGLVFISGGSTTKIEYKRNASFIDTGETQGEFFIFAGDSMRITYPGAVPTVSFVKR